MHLWEPVALLQPWQHCPPHTFTPGSWCLLRSGRPALLLLLLLAWGLGGALCRGPKRAGLAKEAAGLWGP